MPLTGLVLQIFKEKGIVSEILPEYLSKIATDELRKAGVNIFAEKAPVNSSLNENNNVKLVLDSGGFVLKISVPVYIYLINALN